MKKHILKNLFKTVAATLAVTLLAACGSAPAQDSTPAQADSTAPAASTAGTPSNPDAKVITVWTKDRADSEYMTAAVDEYNRTNTHGYIVEYQIYSDNYPSAISLAFQNGEAPDIMVSQNDMFQNWVNAGKYADLTPFMDDEFKETFGENFYEGINMIDGKIYYVPTACTVTRLFYNTEIFERAGIENPPTTLEEMIEDAKIITEKLSGEGIYGFAANMKSPSSALSRSFDMMAQMSCGIHKGYDFKAGQYDFTQLADLIEVWQELMSPECAFPGCESLDIDPLRTQFADGKIGMYISFTHAEPGVYANQFPMDSSKWAVADIPTLTGKQVGAETFQAMNGYCLNAEGENIEDAWVVYRELFADVDLLAGYYSNGLGISLVPDAIAKANPAECYTANPKLLIENTDAIWPKTPQEANVDAVVVEGEDMYSVFASLIWNDASEADIAAALQDLTDRYNAAVAQGIKDGIGSEIVNPNFDPMKPVA